MRHLVTVTLLLYITCGYTQSNKFFGPESDTKNVESDSIKVKKVKKKLKFGVSVGLGSTILSELFEPNRHNFNYGSDVVFNLFKRQTINLFPNFNLTFSKTLKKNSILFTPGIRSITAKLKPTNSTVSDVFFGVNSSDSYLFKELKINQLYIDLPIIYNIKLNDIFSINLGLSVNLPISANFFGNYNSIIIQTNNENLVQKAHYNSANGSTPLIIGDTINYLSGWGSGLDYFILPNNFNIDDLYNGDKLTRMHIQGSPINLNLLTTIIGGVDFSFNKKNKINLNYRLSTSRSSYMITNFLIKEEWFWNPTGLAYKDWRLESKYFESKEFFLQFLEINYIHLF